LKVVTEKIRGATSGEIFRTGNLSDALRGSGYFCYGNRTNCGFLHNMLEQLKNVNTVNPVFV
jgi:hypothetical protein